MAAIGKSVVTYLATKVGVTNLIGTAPMRMRPDGERPKARGPETMPYCVIIGGEQDHVSSLAGVTAQHIDEITIESYATTRSGADALADAIEAEMHGLRSTTVGAHAVQASEQLTRNDTHEDNAEGSAFNRKYITVQQFLISYQ